MLNLLWAQGPKLETSTSQIYKIKGLQGHFAVSFKKYSNAFCCNLLIRIFPPISCFERFYTWPNCQIRSEKWNLGVVFGMPF